MTEPEKLPPGVLNITTRFAPSPTGFLHLGHAFAAWQAFGFAAQNNGRFVLRIEDTDHTRCRPEFETAILEDLHWLGLTWEEPVRRQSDHLAVYKSYIDHLTELGLTYPCFCSRKEILEASAAANLPIGPDGPLYPGTCRKLTPREIHRHQADGRSHVLRLDLTEALKKVPPSLTFDEVGSDGSLPKGPTPVDATSAGDIVLARKGSTTSYHASVVVDDHLQGITDVVRGRDLYSATHIHRLLQELWGFEAPRYHHHDLLLDSDGRKLSKRDQDHAIRAMKKAGKTPADLKEMIEENLAAQNRG
ncbi:MAG: tRNA glutamyl-Q(34) synthetase GluQRS [Alphaproteobacteria bacterium]|nr:MAG: tRNA glutamyl-Q(34) synthetase GluQRS [Alphaproteobacteria bacterium]